LTTAIISEFKVYTKCVSGRGPLAGLGGGERDKEGWELGKEGRETEGKGMGREREEKGRGRGDGEGKGKRRDPTKFRE